MAETKTTGPTGHSPPRVAVVDDDESFVRSLGRLLRSAGFPVQTFCSGGDFLAALPENAPECIVLDVHMPEMNGLELHDKLLAQGVTLPVVFMTAQETPRIRQHVRLAGSELLLKPFDKQTLMHAIAKAVPG